MCALDSYGADNSWEVLLSPAEGIFRRQVFRIFRIAKRYREVNWAQNEGHASAVRPGHTRQWCTCTPWGGREALGGVPTTVLVISTKSEQVLG